MSQQLDSGVQLRSLLWLAGHLRTLFAAAPVAATSRLGGVPFGALGASADGAPLLQLRSPCPPVTFRLQSER